MPQPAASYYAVLRERGEHWDASLPMRQQQQWDAHAAFMDALADEGVSSWAAHLAMASRGSC